MTTITTAEQLAQPLVIPPEAYISRDYAEAEQERLFRKVWLQAGRVEDLRKRAISSPTISARIR